MKHFKHFALTVLVALVSLSSSAEVIEASVDGIYYSIDTSKKTCSVVPRFDEDNTIIPYYGEIVIPDVITYNSNTYKVTSISNRAFEGANLTSLVIGNNVETFEEHPFSQMGAKLNYGSGEFYNRLRSVTLGKKITVEMASNLLAGFCEYNTQVVLSNLVEVKPSESNPYLTSEDGVLYDKDKTKLIWFPQGKNADEYVFPSTVNTIGAYAFRHTNITELNIPSHITNVEQFAYMGCNRFKDIVWPSHIAEIPNYCFTIYSDLVDLVNNTLEELVIPEGVTKIGDYAFEGYTNIKKLVFPNSLTTIGRGTFNGITELETLLIPHNVTSIGPYTFYCEKLKTIYNASSLDIKAGASTFGGVAQFATSVIPVSYRIFNGNDEEILTKNTSLATEDNALLFSFFDDPSPSANHINPNNHAASIVLTDSKPFYCPENITAETVTYSRTFKNTNWQSLYVPYNLSFEDWNGKAKVAELSGVHMYENSPTIIEFITVNSGDLLPNTPYVIRSLSESTEPVVFTSTDKVLKASPEEETRFISCSSSRWIYKFYGNYQTLPLERVEALEAKVLGSGKLIPSSTAVKPMRFYLVKEKSGNGYWGAPSRNVGQEEILVMIDGELLSSEEADAILNAFAGREDGKAYNINGMNVGEDYKGVVIKNGKKIIKK